jgi:hypothetical protein
LLKDATFVPAGIAKACLWLSLCSLIVSAFLGFICATCRLWDFRGTARRACNHPEAPPKGELRELGDMTWVLFYLQLFAFGIGVATLGTALVLTYGNKLL